MQKDKQGLCHIQETINRNCTKISRGWLEERGSYETAQIYVSSLGNKGSPHGEREISFELPSGREFLGSFPKC